MQKSSTRGLLIGAVVALMGHSLCSAANVKRTQDPNPRPDWVATVPPSPSGKHHILGKAEKAETHEEAIRKALEDALAQARKIAGQSKLSDDQVAKMRERLQQDQSYYERCELWTRKQGITRRWVNLYRLYLFSEKAAPPPRRQMVGIQPTKLRGKVLTSVKWTGTNEAYAGLTKLSQGVLADRLREAGYSVAGAAPLSLEQQFAAARKAGAAFLIAGTLSANAEQGFYRFKAGRAGLSITVYSVADGLEACSLSSEPMTIAVAGATLDAAAERAVWKVSQEVTDKLLVPAD